MPELIVFPNDQEILYFNDCEYTVDFEKKSFEAKADDLEIDITQVNQKFCRHDNIFIAFSSENESKGFALVFPDDQGSKEINESFKKMRQTNGMNINYFRPTFHKFLSLLFNAIKNKVKNATDLRQISSSISFSDEEKEKYKDIIPIQAVTVVKQESNVIVSEQPIMKTQSEDFALVEENPTSIQKEAAPATSSAKPSAVYIELLDSDEEEESQNFPSPSNASSILPELNDSRETNNIGRGKRTRSTKRKSLVAYHESSGSNYSDDEEFCSTPILKKRKKRVSNISGEIVKPPNYKFIQIEHQGKIIEKIFVPCKDNSNFGYEYAPLCREKGYFYCYPCKKKKSLSVNIILYKNRVGDDYIRLNSVSHQCNSQKRINSVEKTDNETTMDSSGENLQNFAGGDRPFSNGNSLNLAINQSRQNEIEQKPRLEAIRVSPSESFLTIANKTQPENLNNASNIQNESPNFDNQENNENHEQRNSHINRFNTNRLSTSSNHGRKSNGSKELIRLTDYKLEYFTKPDGTKIQQLTIYESVNKKLCRTFYLNQSTKAFLCCACKMLGNYVRVKLFPNDEGNTKEMFAEYGRAKHLCEPQSEGQIIYPNMFKIRRNGFGEIKNLIIFTDEDKQLCYHFTLMRGNRFFCNCNRKVGAKIFENDQKEYYVKLGNVPHLCQPIPYSLSTSHV